MESLLSVNVFNDEAAVIAIMPPVAVDALTLENKNVPNIKYKKFFIFLQPLISKYIKTVDILKNSLKKNF
jgi:hypothetical protein